MAIIYSLFTSLFLSRGERGGGCESADGICLRSAVRVPPRRCDRMVLVFFKSKTICRARLSEPPDCSARCASHLRRTRSCWPAPLSLPKTFLSVQPLPLPEFFDGAGIRGADAASFVRRAMKKERASGGSRDQSLENPFLLPPDKTTEGDICKQSPSGSDLWSDGRVV